MSKSQRLQRLGIALGCFAACASLAAYFFLGYQDAEPFYMVSLVLAALSATCLLLR